MKNLDESNKVFYAPVVLSPVVFFEVTSTASTLFITAKNMLDLQLLFCNRRPQVLYLHEAQAVDRLCAELLEQFQLNFQRSFEEQATQTSDEAVLRGSRRESKSSTGRLHVLLLVYGRRFGSGS